MTYEKLEVKLVTCENAYILDQIGYEVPDELAKGVKEQWVRVANMLVCGHDFEPETYQDFKDIEQYLSICGYEINIEVEEDVYRLGDVIRLSKNYHVRWVLR